VVGVGVTSVGMVSPDSCALSGLLCHKENAG
jgi:hypothetical protein